MQSQLKRRGPKNDTIVTAAVGNDSPVERERGGGGGGGGVKPVLRANFALGSAVIHKHLSHDTTKRVFGSFRPGQTQTGLRSHRS